MILTPIIQEAEEALALLKEEFPDPDQGYDFLAEVGVGPRAVTAAVNRWTAEAGENPQGAILTAFLVGVYSAQIVGDPDLYAQLISQTEVLEEDLKDFLNLMGLASVDETASLDELISTAMGIIVGSMPEDIQGILQAVGSMAGLPTQGEMAEVTE